jgi:hypothetical protein
MCIKRGVPLSLAMLNMVTIHIPWDDVPPGGRKPNVILGDE